MGNNTKYVWTGLVIQDIKAISRQGKQDLRFVSLIDPQTYETSGEFMYMPDDRAEQLPPKGTKVDVYTKPSTYQNKASIMFASIVPTKTA